MKQIALLVLLGTVYGQQRSCVYNSGPNNVYTSNLTSVTGFHLEYEGPDHFYYYTPCHNGEVCDQGNAEFHANAVQYKQGANQCEHYISVDHQEQPQYMFGGASWLFQYSDGQICDETQQPRRTNVWMQCDEHMAGGAYLYDASEDRTCEYALVVRTPLACVPENSHNANCQWKYFDHTANISYYFDLSSQNGTYIHGKESSNGYEMYYTPCQNGLHCYQQTGDMTVMSMVENDVTRTCDHYLAEWQQGRVQPYFHNTNTDEIHWSFHYWLSEKCSDGSQGE
eukprot:92955_1